MGNEPDQVIMLNMDEMTNLQQNSNSEQHPKQNNSIRVSIKLIQKAIDQGFINELSFYYLLKFTFKNSCIYDIEHAKKRLADQFGISLKTIYNRLNKLSELDLCFTNAGNLILIPKSKQFYKTVIIVSDKPTANEIKNLLLSKVLEREGRQQAFNESLKKYISGNEGKTRLYKIRTEEKKFFPSISCRHFAKLINNSEYTAHKVLKDLNETGVLRSTNQHPEYMFPVNPSVVKMNYFEGFPGYKFIKANDLFKVDPAFHEFLQHPIKTKEMTFRKYRNAVKDPAIRKYVNKISQSIDNEIPL